MSIAPSQYKNIGAYLKHQVALTPNTVGANSTGAGTEQTGLTIDREALTSHPYASAKVGILCTASLGAGETLTIAANAQDSTGSTAGWADLADIDGSTGISQVLGSTGSTAAQTVTEVVELELDLSKAKQFVRVQVTPTFTSSSTTADDVDLAGVATMGGPNILPAA